MPHKDIPVKKGTSLTSVNKQDIEREMKGVYGILHKLRSCITDTYTVEDVDKQNADFDHLPLQLTRLDTDPTLTIPDSTTVNIPWIQAEFDTHGYWAVANPTLINIHVGGVYQITLDVAWANNSNGIRQLWITTVAAGPTIVLARHVLMPQNATVSIRGTTQQFTFMTHFPSRDVITAKVMQTSGGPLDILNARLELQRIRAHDKPRSVREVQGV